MSIYIFKIKEFNCYGKTYTVLYRNTMSGDAWCKLSDVPAQTTTGVVEIPDLGAGSSRIRFYRLVTPQSP